MANIKKHDIDGKEIGQVEISDALLDTKSHRQLVKDYIVAIRNNQRQWSANTKGRAEVKCTSKKPHAQKGTGRARQGSYVSPQFRGGGIVFGPKPKPASVRTRINAKEKRAAIRHLLADKIKQGAVTVISQGEFTAPKTKPVAKFLNALEITGKRVLFLGQMGAEEAAFVKSTANLPRVYFGKAIATNGYDLMNSGHIVVTESAVDDLMKLLGETNA